MSLSLDMEDKDNFESKCIFWLSLLSLILLIIGFAGK